MAVPLPGSFHDLLTQPILASLATSMPDGAPHVTPVWFDCDLTYVYVNSVVGYRKDRNLRADPRLALLIVDPTCATRYISIRGRVIDFSDAVTGREHLNRLSLAYTGQAEYTDDAPGDIHVCYTIEPLHIATMG